MIDWTNPVNFRFLIVFVILVIFEVGFLFTILYILYRRKELKIGDLKFFYYAYVEIISIFPLLGMLGTVASLLSFSNQLQDGNLDAVKQNFFSALWTTFAGLVCAIVFKAIHALISSKVENRQAELDGEKKAEVEDEG